ncbi:MAG: hypothetical protein LPK03_08890 [Pontibacter sp.]|nr:hypothetical protein [Pontibacter sp.]
MDTPLINGRAYSWADVKVMLLGKKVDGITAINYGDTQEKQNNYGAGIHASSRGYGKLEATASITLEKKEVERIQAALGPGRRLQDIAPFPITVAYVNEANLAVTHKLFNCEFTNNKREVKAGDMNIEVELELILSHIQW